MRVSVAIKAKNNEKNIEQCLNGVLSQTRLPDEIILVDYSTDNTYGVAENILKKAFIPSKLVKQDRAGAGYAVHLCVTNASGDIIVLTDGDSVMSETLLEATCETLRDTGVTAVGAKSYPLSCFPFSGLFTFFSEERVNKKPAGRYMAFRARDYFDVGGLIVDGIYTGYYEDFIIAERLMKKGRMVILDDPIYTEMPTTTQKIFLQEIVGGGMIVGGLVDVCFKGTKRWWVDLPVVMGGIGLLIWAFSKRKMFFSGKLRRFV